MPSSLLDPFGKVHRSVICNSTLIVAVLPALIWHEAKQTMEWKSKSLEPINYTGYVKFINKDTMKWTTLGKAWKGTVILDLEGTSKRRK